MFRFVHTADVHLDSPLHSLALRDPEAAAQVANATRQCFTNIIDLCISESVDALIIAGDLYDGELRSMKTAEFFAAEMRRLVAADIRAFIVRGNHDAESRITRELQLPEGVHVFASGGESVLLDTHDVVIHGVSFSKPKAPRSLLPHYPPRRPGLRNIGLLHTSLAGSPQHDTYAPCSLDDLAYLGYDYWALGHIHQRTVHPLANGGFAVMPGIPQGRHINEAGVKSVTLVTLDGAAEMVSTFGGEASIADQDGSLDTGEVTGNGIRILERVTSQAQFERLALDLSDVEDWRDFVERSELALRTLAGQRRAPSLVVRITLQGTTPLTGTLRRDTDRTLSELKEAGRRAGSVYIDKVVQECRAPGSETASGGDPVAELRTLMARPGLDRDAIADQTRALLEELQGRLPPELRDSFGGDAQDALIQDYLREGAEDVLARLERRRDLAQDDS